MRRSWGAATVRERYRRPLLTVAALRDRDDTMRDIAFFISWTCYGQWLHGDQRGSVDETHNEFGLPWLSTDVERHQGERERMSQSPYELDAPRRRLVLQSIQDVCAYRGWTLHAVHVRARHVHVVVSGNQTSERMMNDFKSYAS